jgi:hypothetical protein
MCKERGPNGKKYVKNMYIKVGKGIIGRKKERKERT